MSLQSVEPITPDVRTPDVESADFDIPDIVETPSGDDKLNGKKLNGYTNGKVPSYIDQMAHLSVVKDKDSDAASIRSTSSRRSVRPTLQLSNYEDEFTTSVYGSRFAAMDLPKHHMPECEMPREIAYRMIKDDLSLDNNPMLK